MPKHDETPPEELDQRSKWFDWYCDRIDNRSVLQPKRDGVKYACPCCHCLTLDSRGSFEICPVCFWEDDGQDDADADTIRCGPNRSLSLTQARQNYRDFGASDRRMLEHVRPPTEEEKSTRRSS